MSGCGFQISQFVCIAELIAVGSCHLLPFDDSGICAYRVSPYLARLQPCRNRIEVNIIQLNLVQTFTRLGDEHHELTIVAIIVSEIVVETNGIGLMVFRIGCEIELDYIQRHEGREVTRVGDNTYRHFVQRIRGRTVPSIESYLQVLDAVHIQHTRDSIRAIRCCRSVQELNMPAEDIGGTGRSTFSEYPAAIVAGRREVFYFLTFSAEVVNVKRRTYGLESNRRGNPLAVALIAAYGANIYIVLRIGFYRIIRQLERIGIHDRVHHNTLVFRFDVRRLQGCLFSHYELPLIRRFLVPLEGCAIALDIGNFDLEYFLACRYRIHHNIIHDEVMIGGGRSMIDISRLVECNILACACILAEVDNLLRICTTCDIDSSNRIKGSDVIRVCHGTYIQRLADSIDVIRLDIECHLQLVDRQFQ